MIPRSRELGENVKEAYLCIYMAIGGDDNEGGDYNGWSISLCFKSIIGGPALGMDVPNK